MKTAGADKKKILFKTLTSIPLVRPKFTGCHLLDCQSTQIDQLTFIFSPDSAWKMSKSQHSFWTLMYTQWQYITNNKTVIYRIKKKIKTQGSIVLNTEIR